ncbi:MAG: PEP-CTERM system TPR-repeat protein PrsT [Colwellia sp.]|nr:PEP-CTERM system TPR-repeat protein PrsT [Colwellia sp.]
MKYKQLILTTCVALSLAACSPNKTSEEYMQSAQKSILAKDDASAVIDIKNAIRIDKKNVEARFLLGTLYLRQGDAASAEKELQRAIDLGKAIELTFPKLLKSLNLQNKQSDVLPMIALHKDGVVELLPQVLFYAGLANINAGEKDAAIDAFMQAIKISPDSSYSKLGSAYLSIEAKNIDEALFQIEDSLKDNSLLSEAYMLKGNLLHVRKDYSNAVKAFQQYHKLLPKDLKVRMFLARDLIQDKQFSEATKHLDYLIKLFPEQPYVNQLKGVLSYEEGSYQSSLYFTEKAIQNGVNSPSNRVVAGISAFNLQQYELSYKYLVGITDQLQENHPLNKLLISIKMQLGYTADAINSINEIQTFNAEDLSLLTKASFELLKSGDFANAKELIQKSDELHSDNAIDITRLGILKLSISDVEGIANLEEAIDISPELPLARMALASAYLYNKDYEKAHDLANKWKLESDNSIDGYRLAARTFLLQNDIDKAEIEFHKILEFTSESKYALIYFAQKYFDENKKTESLKYVKRVLAFSPYHIGALTISYRLGKLVLGNEAFLQNIAIAHEKNIDNMDYVLLYARALFGEKKFSEVVFLLKSDYITSVQTPSMYWAILGTSYNQLEDHESALSVFDDWTEKKPNYREAWLKKMTEQEVLNDYEGALRTVDSVLTKVGHDTQFAIIKVNYQIRLKYYEKAQSSINALSTDEKKLPSVKGLQAQIYLTKEMFSQAVPGLKELYKLDHSSRHASLVYIAMTKMGNKKGAFNFLKLHVSDKNDDLLSTNLLAELAIEYDLELARKLYYTLLDNGVVNGSLLNNLAWVEYKLKNYTKAEKMSERAVKSLNRHPKALDTLGLIKLMLGKKDDAVKLLEEASKLLPSDKLISEHLKSAKT